MSRFRLLRYFWIVAPPKAYLCVVLLLLGAGGIYLEFQTPGASETAIAGILLIQLFAVSTGFTTHASRGYFDPALTSGSARASIALAHFFVSASPGFAAWALVGAAQVLRAGSLDVVAFRPAGLAGLLLVSTVPWALTLRLPALSGGALWLLLMIGMVIAGKMNASLAAARLDTRWFSLHPWRAVGFGLTFPLFIPDIRWAPLTLGSYVILAAAALSLGILYVQAASFPLAEEN
jgi:hypothetical protein